MTKSLLFLILGLQVSLALAQGADVGMINMTTSDITYTPSSGMPGKVQAFMKVRDGDVISIPAGGQVRVVFFQSARQERWIGPASFRAGTAAAAPISGKAAEVVALPVGVPQRLAQVPQLVQTARLGGIQVRGVHPMQKPSAEQQSTIAAARATYEAMRKNLSPDDITPELYLYAALDDYLLYDDMLPIVDEMLRKQPKSDEVRALASFVRSKTAR